MSEDRRQAHTIDGTPHHCSGCDRDFNSVDGLLNHDCGGEDAPDDDGGSDPTALADGGAEEMSPLAEDFDADLGSGPDPTAEPCPTCGADAGESCQYYGGKGAGEPKGTICVARRRAARRAGR